MSTAGNDPSGLATRTPASLAGRTGRMPWSTQLLREWASVKYPNAFFREQVRLGPTEERVLGVALTPALEAALRVWNWYEDGLLVTDAEVLHVEAKVQPNPSAVGQILFYVQLARRTPDFVDLMDRPFVPVVLFAEEDDEVTAFANSLGVRVETYTPQWIADYLTRVQFRGRGSRKAGT